MYKKELPQYKRKLEYISKNASNIDYDWFNKHGKLILVNDVQYNEEYNTFRQGFLSMDRRGKFCFIFNVVEDEKQLITDLAKDEDHPCSINDHDFNPTDLDWIFENVSVNGLLWKINKIYDELTN